MFRSTSSFSLPPQAVKRLGQFLTSPERSAEIKNVNRYWLTRRMALSFALSPDGVIIQNDSNLQSRITPADRERLNRILAVPSALAAVIERMLPLVLRFAHRLEKFVFLHKAGRQLRAIEKQSALQKEGSLPFGLCSRKPELASSRVFYGLSESWPERTMLMLHALDLVSHFAPHRDNNRLRVLEIGSGPAILAGLMMHSFNSRHVLVDLPEQIAVGFSMLSEFFQDKRILLTNEASAGRINFDEYDAVFLTPEQAGKLDHERFDVAVNMFSFGEMSHETIRDYFQLIRRQLEHDGIFYCANRVSKFNPHDGTTVEFANYPWNREDNFLWQSDMKKVPYAQSRGYEARECVAMLSRQAQ